MKIEYDQEVDVLYIRIQEKEVYNPTRRSRNPM